MKTLILVHGTFADGHSFDAIVPLLQARQFKVLAPHLPGHGGDAAPTAQLTLESYVAAVSGLVEREDDVVLVGHSMAGMIVSQVAERHPQRLDAVVYVAGYLPCSGDSLQKLAEGDPDSLVGQNMQFAADYSTVTLKHSAVAQAICADVAEPVQRLIVAGQKPEALKPFQGTVSLTPERFGSVKKAYIQTENDRAVTPSLQAKMLARYPAMPTQSMKTSHLPFVAQPDAFVQALMMAIELARVVPWALQVEPKDSRAR